MNGRILVVDDDEGLQRAIRRALETAGYEVVQAFDGIDALNLVTTAEFDMILLDINMPTIDGRDVLSRLKRSAATADIPVLVLSARSGQLDRHVALQLGAADYVDKPMDPALLTSKIGRLIEAARTRTQN